HAFALDPEVYARLGFCRRAIEALSDIRQRVKAYDNDQAAVAKLVADTREFFLTFGGMEDLKAFDQALPPNYETIEDVRRAFRKAASSTRWRGKLGHLKGVRRRLPRQSNLTEEQAQDLNYSPYAVHPEIGRLASLDMGLGNEVLQTWLELGKVDSWNPETAVRNPRAALEHIATVYGSFLIERPAFIVEGDPSPTQAAVDIWVARAVFKVGILQGFGNLKWLTAEAPDRWRSSQQETNRLLVYLRMLFVTELIHPGIIEGQTRIKVAPWVASHLNHPDQRPFGVKYASAMNLLLLDFHHLALAMARFDEESEAASGDPGTPRATIPQHPHPLLGIRPVLTETLAEWQKSPPIDLRHPNAFGPFEAPNLSALIGDLEQSLAVRYGNRLSSSGVSYALPNIIARLLLTEQQYGHYNEQIEEFLAQHPPRHP
ncbi:MAG: hypothetical protein HY537_02365, partial [Deltaproteobacteria bacterium]|nr:hypothetical protein [Deltaproteobacteria bacterium]